MTYKPNFNFYTIWSNVFFYIVLILYAILRNSLPREILYAAVINQIIVGIIGNILLCDKTQAIFNTYKRLYPKASDLTIYKYILVNNIALHTVPLIVSIIILQCINPQSFNLFISAAIIIALFFIWMCVPDTDGKMFIGKINNQYGKPGVIYFVMCAALLIGLLLTSKYQSNICGHT